MPADAVLVGDLLELYGGFARTPDLTRRERDFDLCRKATCAAERIERLTCELSLDGSAGGIDLSLR